MFDCNVSANRYHVNSDSIPVRAPFYIYQTTFEMIIVIP